MRLTKKVRFEAIALCSVAASHAVPVPHDAEVPLAWRFSPPLDLERFVRALEVTPEAGELADEVQAVALDRMARVKSLPDWCALFVERYRLAWAEAECLLREGFVPEGWRC